MSIDPKKFGLSPSLLETVKEALKGDQHKLDVAEPKGKLTSADFKKLRGEDAKPDYLDFDKDGNKKEPMKKALKDKEVKEVADGNAKNFKANMKEGPEEKDVTNPKQGSSVDPKQRSIGEAAPAGAPNVADQMAAKKDALKTQIQRKIAQKQMSMMQAKANKRISNMKEGDGKCSCGDTNESKMRCEVHGGKHDDKKGKGGREAIVMNPPLKEAEELPKKVVKKGHEIAKSLIKHRAKVKSPYAVGMATAKKSAGIKEEAELDEALAHNMDAGELRQHLAKKYGHIEHGHFVHPNTRETYMYHVKRLAKMIGKHPDHVRKQVKKDYKHASDMGEGVQNESVYPERHAAAKKIIGDVAKKKGGKVNFQSTSFKDGKKVTVHGYHDEKGERHVTHTTTEEVQIDELSKETMKSYIKAVDKRKEGVKRGTGVNTASQKIAKQEPSKTLHKTISSLDKKPHSRLKSSDVYKYGAAHRELKKRGEIKTS